MTKTTYRTWADVPERLATKTQLSKLGLKPAPDQEPVAYKKSYNRHTADYALYDQDQAIPKREMSDAQRSNLEKARQQAALNSRCARCRLPFDYIDSDRYPNPEGKHGAYICFTCRDRDRAVEWARKLVEQGFVVLDLETTGLSGDDEAVSLAVVDQNGTVLIDTLLCHTKPSGPGAYAVHGHTWEETRSAPTFVEVWPQLVEAIQDKALVIYNKEFDLRIIEQMMKRYQIDATPVFRRDAACAMLAFAQYYGDWDDRRRSYTWKKLGDAAFHLGLKAVDLHRAAGDAELTRQLVETMARQALPGEMEDTE